jgi:hypothetical protein
MLVSEQPRMARRGRYSYLISCGMGKRGPEKRYACFDSSIVLIHWLDDKKELNFDLTSNVTAANFILAETGLMFGTRQLERTWHECYKTDIPERS